MSCSAEFPGEDHSLLIQWPVCTWLMHKCYCCYKLWTEVIYKGLQVIKCATGKWKSFLETPLRDGCSGSSGKGCGMFHGRGENRVGSAELNIWEEKALWRFGRRVRMDFWTSLLCSLHTVSVAQLVVQCSFLIHFLFLSAFLFPPTFLAKIICLLTASIAN